MDDRFSGLLELRIQVLRIAEAARSVHTEAAAAGAVLIGAVQEIIQRADTCRQLIDGHLDPNRPTADMAPLATPVAPVLADAAQAVTRGGGCSVEGVLTAADATPAVVLSAPTLRRILTGLLEDACGHARPGTHVGVKVRGDVVETHIDVIHQPAGIDEGRLQVLSGHGELSHDEDYAAGIALNSGS
jgi:K+-sensing histidine kinase KdpD